MATDLAVGVRIRLVDAFSAPLKRMTDRLADVKKEFGKLKETFRLAADLNLAAGNVGAFGSGIISALKPAFEEFKGFESQMSELGALSKTIGTEAFGQLKKQAMDLGAATSYSGTEAAAAMTELARAGKTANEIMAITPTVLSLARASGLGLAETAEILGGAMNGMGLEAGESVRVANVMVRTFTGAATGLGDLGEAFKMVAPFAKQSKISVETLSVALGALANSQIKGTMAGTGLQGVLAGILAPSKAATLGFAQFGIKAKVLTQIQKDLAGGDLGGVLKQIAEAGAKLPDEKRLKLLENIFGRESLKSATILLDASVNPDAVKGWDALERKVNDARKTAGGLAFVMEDNLAGELERTGGAISGLSLQIGEKLKPSIVATSQAVAGLVEKVSGWVERNPDLANSLIRLAVVTAGAALAIKAIIITVGAMVSTYGVLRGAYLGIKAAMIVTTAATNATSAAMFTTLIPSFMRARLAAIASSAAFTAMSGSMAGKAGLLGAAALLGVTIGTLLRQWLDLDRVLSNTIGWIMGVDLEKGRTGDTKIGAGHDQAYGDGTVIDGKTGEVKVLGTGPAALAPKAVRDARNAGVTDRAGINSRIAAAKAASAAPAAPSTTPGDPATKEQTKVLDQHNREQTKLLRELRDAARKSRRPGVVGDTAPAAGGVGAH